MVARKWMRTAGKPALPRMICSAYLRLRRTGTEQKFPSSLTNETVLLFSAKMASGDWGRRMGASKQRNERRRLTADADVCITPCRHPAPADNRRWCGSVWAPPPPADASCASPPPAPWTVGNRWWRNWGRWRGDRGLLAAGYWSAGLTSVPGFLGRCAGSSPDKGRLGGVCFNLRA